MSHAASIRRSVPRGRVVIITGGSGTLGSALVRAFLAEGDRVWSISRQGRGKAAVKGCEYLRADVCDLAQVSAAAKRVHRTAGPCDVWINNAGGGTPVPFDAPDFGRWREIFDLNFEGTLNGCRCALPILRRPGSGVINIASLAGLMAPPGHAAYATAKAAVLALTRSLAVEYAAAGVRFNAVAPGPLASPAFQTKAGQLHPRTRTIPTRQLAEPAEVAAACVWLTRAGPSVTGHTVVIDGAASAAGAYV